MLKKIRICSFLLLCVILNCYGSGYGASSAINTDYKSPNFLFRLSNELTEELDPTNKYGQRLTPELLNKIVEESSVTAFDLVDEDSNIERTRIVDSIGPGNYLWVSLKHNGIYSSFLSVYPFKISIVKDYEKLLVFVCDSLGRPLTDAEVLADNQPLTYNPSTSFYETDVFFPEAKIRVNHNGLSGFFFVSNAEKQCKKRPAKFFQAIGRVVKDPVTSIREGDAVGYVAKFARLFEKISDRKTFGELDSSDDYYEFDEFYNYETGEYMDLDELRQYDFPRYQKILYRCAKRDQRHGRKLSYEEKAALDRQSAIRHFRGCMSDLVLNQPVYKPNDTVRSKLPFTRTVIVMVEQSPLICVTRMGDRWICWRSV